MISIIKYLIVVLLLINTNTFPQLAEDSWSFGFGGTYPRFMGIWSKSYSGTENYGAFVSIKRNFSENVALRLLGNFAHMEAIYDFRSREDGETVKLYTTSLDLIYYLVPCDPISPYIGVGFGGIYFKPENAFEDNLEKFHLEYQMNLRAGAEWMVSDDWYVTTEASYITPSSNKLDGENNTHEHKGLFGTNCDTYMTFNLGFLYYFSKGDPSPKCDLYPGITVGTPTQEQLTYNDVEKIVKENLPKEIVKEIVIEKPTVHKEDRWVLVGVNFEFNSANLTKESFPILLNAIQVLTKNPDVKIEIRGYTDNIGSESFNQSLSERRANVVKDYLASNGIEESRLEAKGFGESDPIGDNNTIEGRTLNRRIEFKVKK